jgi:hypothetical protein
MSDSPLTAFALSVNQPIKTTVAFASFNQAWTVADISAVTCLFCELDLSNFWLVLETMVDVNFKVFSCEIKKVLAYFFRE